MRNRRYIDMNASWFWHKFLPSYAYPKLGAGPNPSVFTAMEGGHAPKEENTQLYQRVL